jgi:cardiolipin synthase
MESGMRAIGVPVQEPWEGYPMSTLRKPLQAPAPRTPTVREWSDQAITRAVSAPVIHGNRVRLLKDAAENYPTWLEAIRGAKRWVHFETYFIRDDFVGREFAEVLSAKAREGVPVRLLYDWVGAFGHAGLSYWADLREAGVDVRCFNPPRLDSPLSVLSRDHRKMIGVDGAVGFVSGLCVGGLWVGDAAKGLDPWRDTGLLIEGPALEEIEAAFAAAWSAAGSPLPAGEIPHDGSIPMTGTVGLRVVANTPTFSGTYRLDLLFAALARHYMWIHDSYFLGTPAYIQALRAAAAAGVDVRMIVPGTTDVSFMRGLSRAGFRPMLEAGVRVFQWNGSMMHAKTAVVDGKWARIGSTNLNLSSWLGNWEMDLMVEDQNLAEAMEAQYLEDLNNTTEIVLGEKNGMRRRPMLVSGTGRRVRAGSASRVAAGVVRLGSSVSAAVTNRRPLGPAEANVMAVAALMLITVALLAVYVPKAITIPVVILCSWIALGLLVQACKLRFKRRDRDKDNP